MNKPFVILCRLHRLGSFALLCTIRLGLLVLCDGCTRKKVSCTTSLQRHLVLFDVFVNRLGLTQQEAE